MDRWVRSLFGLAAIMLLIVMQLSVFGCNGKASQSVNAAPHFANGGNDTEVLLREAAQANFSHNIVLQKKNSGASYQHPASQPRHCGCRETSWEDVLALREEI